MVRVVVVVQAMHLVVLIVDGSVVSQCGCSVGHVVVLGGDFDVVGVASVMLGLVVWHWVVYRYVVWFWMVYKRQGVRIMVWDMRFRMMWYMWYMRIRVVWDMRIWVVWDMWSMRIRVVWYMWYMVWLSKQWLGMRVRHVHGDRRDRLQRHVRDRDVVAAVVRRRRRRRRAVVRQPVRHDVSQILVVQHMMRVDVDGNQVVESGPLHALRLLLLLADAPPLAEEEPVLVRGGGEAHPVDVLAKVLHEVHDGGEAQPARERPAALEAVEHADEGARDGAVVLVVAPPVAVRTRSPLLFRLLVVLLPLPHPALLGVAVFDLVFARRFRRTETLAAAVLVLDAVDELAPGVVGVDGLVLEGLALPGRAVAAAARALLDERLLRHALHGRQQLGELREAARGGVGLGVGGRHDDDDEAQRRRQDTHDEAASRRTLKKNERK